MLSIKAKYWGMLHQASGENRTRERYYGSTIYDVTLPMQRLLMHPSTFAQVTHG